MIDSVLIYLFLAVEFTGPDIWEIFFVWLLIVCGCFCHLRGSCAVGAAGVVDVVGVSVGAVCSDVSRAAASRPVKKKLRMVVLNRATILRNAAIAKKYNFCK